MFTKVTSGLASFWKKLGVGEKSVLIIFMVVTAVTLGFFVVWAGTPDYVVAFSDLTEADASEIIDRLNSEGISYELKDSSTIMVPSENVYEVRLSMAKDGLPSGSTVGFELFNEGNSFMMNEFTQRVNYQQALEGELERTISSLSSVEGVRVHIVIPEKSLLTEDQTPATASVTLQQKTGNSITNAQVQSITHLVASSIEGMDPENVVVVDVNGNLLASGQTDGATASMAMVDNHLSAEYAAARQIESDIQNFLDSILGPNKSVVQAQVVMDWTERETTSQTFDPNSSVVRSEQNVNESQAVGGDENAGVPGADTNLPDGTDGTTTTDGAVIYQHSENVTNYEITETNSREIVAPGQINSISLSVLVDGITDAEVLTKIENGIAAAAGIDAERGDVLVVETLAFDRTFYAEQTADLEQSQQVDMYMEIAKIAGVVLLFGIFFITTRRLFKNLRNSTTEEWTPVMVPLTELQAAATSHPAPTKEEPKQQLMMNNTEDDEPKSLEELIESVPSFAEQLAPNADEIEEKRMRQVVNRLAEENPASVAEIIQLWLNEDIA